MAVSAQKRPIGYVINPTPRLLEVIPPLSGTDAVFQSFGHGLVNSQPIYIKSRVIDYCGFWEVAVIDANYFTIREYFNGPDVEYVTTVQNPVFDTYYLMADTNYWNCVHLPIVYKLISDLWPTNSVDTVRTVSSVANTSGYCEITASGDIKATGSAANLEFVKISTGSLAGVYQIINYTNETIFVINLPHSSANATAITGASIQYYYNNYHARVRVFGGLKSTHRFATQKPYVQLAELKLTPDADNVVAFSVSEILKAQINNRNQLQLGTMPSNLDFFTQFYISVAESYDDSDGSTLSTFVSGYTADPDSGFDFEPYAINAKLPFKNVYSGFMSEYMSSSRKFLTLFDTPTIFIGQYFDISFIIEDRSIYQVRKQYYRNSVLQSTTTTELPSYNEGVYRYPLDEEQCSSGDRLDISLLSLQALLTNPDFNTTAAWTNSGSGGTWGFNSGYVSTTIGATNSTKNLDQSYSNAAGNYRVRISMINQGSVNYRMSFMSAGVSVYDILGAFVAGGNSYDNVVAVPSTFDAVQFRCTDSSLAINTVQLHFLDIYSSPSVVSSEVKSIELNCDCANQSINLSWENQLGGFDHWSFTAEKDYQISITEKIESTENVFPSWPKSFGEFADTITKQTHRSSRQEIVVKSQHLTLAQLTAIQYIKTSTVVQIVNSLYDRRTVIPDNQSFKVYSESDKLYTIQFNILYTDEIGSQSA